MRLQESGEMYLECILRLSREKGNVRSIDLGEYRGYSKPSIFARGEAIKRGRVYKRGRKRLYFFNADGARRGGKDLRAAQRSGGVFRRARRGKIRRAARQAQIFKSDKGET